MRDIMDWKLERNRATRRQVVRGAAFLLGSFVAGSKIAAAANEEGVSHSAEAIHQEVIFKVPRKRVYETLTDAKQFQRVVELSSAMKSGMPPGSPLAQISSDAGGAFSLFGGYITGRHIELVPDVRIVQAWRVGNWDPGIFSVAKFALVEQGNETKIVFDHTGFPMGKGENLAEGWNLNYWEPMKKVLG